MSDLISRSELMKVLRGNAVAKYPSSFYFGLFAAAEEVEKIPAVDAVEVVHGKWVKDRDGDEYCDNCSRYMPVREVTGDPSANNYCPNCGAKMDGERKGDDERA